MAKPVCTKQFCNYRNGREEIDGLDAEVVGITPQNFDSHERFEDTADLRSALEQARGSASPA